MVKNSSLGPLTTAVRVYVALTAVTVLALVVLEVAAPRLATSHAWGHAVVVAVLAVVLPLRLRAAATGSVSGLRAVRLISAVLLVVNLVEALVPDYFPAWMRVQMVVVAVLMGVIVLLSSRASAGAARTDETARLSMQSERRDA